MSKASPPKPEAHLAQLERKIKEKEEELAYLCSDLPSEIKKLKTEINQKNKQIEELSSGTSSSLQTELNKLKVYTEDLKKLEITKDLEINKLNEQLKYKEKEIENLNQTIKDNRPIDYEEKEKTIIKEHQQETNQLNQKINDLELRIYKLNDDKKQLSLENFKLQEKLTHYNEKEENDKQKQLEEEEKDNNQEMEEDACVPKDTYNNLLEECEAVKQELKSTNTELDALKTQLEELQSEMQLLKVLNNEIQTKNSNLEKENETSRQTLNNIKTEYESFKQEFNNIQQSQRDKSALDQNHIKDIKYIKAKHEAELNQKDKEYELLKGENSKVINDYMIKVKELELLNRNLAISLKQMTQAKSDLEEIILKQEEKVSGLGEKVNKIDMLLKNKNNELKQNESYSLQLITIINDQKKQIASIKSNQKETENNEYLSLQNQINTLKATIEVRDTTIAQIQQKHKFLQEKYTKLSSEKRLKPQEELLKEAKEMKQIKIEKEKEKKEGNPRNRSSNKAKNSRNSENNSKNNYNEENKVVPDQIPPYIIPKTKPKSPFNPQSQQQILRNQPQKSSNSTLPLLINEKPFFNMNSLNSVEDTKMDEINNMMRKIIDEF